MSGRPLPSSFDGNEDFYNENAFQKITRRIKEEPLVPIGCILTVAAFTNAWRASRRGDHAQVQRMFRARVAAQGFTVVAICVGGMYFAEDRKKQKELRKLKEAQEAEEKRLRWIKELETRDEEDRVVRDRLDKMRKRAEGRKGGVAAQAKEQADRTGAFTEDADGEGDAEKKTGGGVLGSLGGWFGGSGTTADATKSDGPEDSSFKK
ncbi:hypothetical protein GQ53DRAFT_832164 [Thozetella sp. PMI_491]|nr:hypothetical protein GQ53DRAFT_832164 [Thozetella sp. PMI_491]